MAFEAGKVWNAKKVSRSRAQPADEVADEETTAGPKVAEGEANDEGPLMLFAAESRQGLTV